MGQAIARGAITAHVLRPDEIMVAELEPHKRAALDGLGCGTTDNARVAAECEQVLLAVKPQSFASVAAAIAPLGKPTVVILPADEYERLVADRDAGLRQQAQLAHLDEAEQFAKKVAAHYADRPLPNSVRLIQEIREARDDQLLDLR